MSESTKVVNQNENCLLKVFQKKRRKKRSKFLIEAFCKTQRMYGKEKRRKKKIKLI